MKCETCGSEVKVVSSGEGTSYYEPVDIEAAKAAAIEEAFEAYKNWIIKTRASEYAEKAKEIYRKSIDEEIDQFLNDYNK